MENIVGGFCDSRNYKLVSKKLVNTETLSKYALEQFAQFVQRNRNKRKLAALSFEVNFPLEKIVKISDKLTFY